MYQTSAFGHTYATAGPSTVGVRIYDAQVQAVSFARRVELQKLAMEKRRLEMQEAQMAANREASQRNFDLAEERFALERQRLDIDDADRQQKREMAQAQFQQTMEDRAEARALREQEMLAKRQEAELRRKDEEAKRQEQLALQQQRQQSLDNYREKRLTLLKEQQERKTQGATRSSGKGTSSQSATAYNSAMDEWVKSMESDKATRQAWIATEAKKARGLADKGGDDAEQMARRADALERWGFMNENQRFGTGVKGLYDEVKENTWSDKREKVLDFAKTLRSFAKIHPEIYTDYGLSPLALSKLPWDEVDEDEMDMVRRLMEQRDVTDEDIKFIVNSLLGSHR